MNFKDSMELAGNNLLHMLCPVRSYRPYFHMYCDERLNCRGMFEFPSHNLGRWWDAMMRLEHATGFVVPANIEAAMLANVHLFHDNPYSLCVDPLENEDLYAYCHSFREHLLALNALARYRNSKWAISKGHKMLLTIAQYLNEDCKWDVEGLVKGPFSKVKSPGKDPNVNLTASTGRFVEALVWFYETSGDALALELAHKLAEYHFINSTRSDGSPPFPNPEHTHSYFGTIRGLLLYGKLTNQQKYIARVYDTYKNTVSKVVKKSGFISHDWGCDYKGEAASTGDAAQIALWLAIHYGYTELLDDVERIVRARLLPCQITVNPGFKPEKNEGGDEYAQVSLRLLGAYGGMHKKPHGGKISTTDITASVLHTLIDIYDKIVENKPEGVVINFHFDYEDNLIKIISKRENQATLKVYAKCPGNILVRVPGWTDVKTIKTRVGSKQIQSILVGKYLFISSAIRREVGESEPILLNYDLPVTVNTETTNNTDYRFTWRGDEVLSISPQDDPLSFYPVSELSRRSAVVVENNLCAIS